MTCITKRDSKQLASGSPASAAAGGSRIETTDKGQKSYETLANRTCVQPALRDYSVVTVIVQCLDAC